MTDLDFLIHHWQSKLSQNRYLLEPSEIYLIDETIRQLEHLKALEPVGRSAGLPP